MSDREWVAGAGMYLGISAILDGLLADVALRSIAQAARESLQIAFAAVSFRAPGFSSSASLFVRDRLLAPLDYAPCTATAASADMLMVPHLTVQCHSNHDTVKLRSYAGCALLDWHGNCVGVFYLMDTRPHWLTPLETFRFRCYTHLVSSRIEIVRRFGVGSRGPSPGEIIRRADQLASVGQDSEAQDLIALAYAAHDIAGIRQRTPDHMPS